MVANSRKTAGPSPIRALNRPQPVAVGEDHDQRPLSVLMGRRKLSVVSVEDVWELVDEWWRKTPIARRYYEVVMESGPHVILFRDLVGGSWYRQGA